MARAPSLDVVVYTALALMAFAANSILTRLGLATRSVDAATFSFVRVASGAVTLAVLVRAQSGGWPRLRSGGWAGPAALFGYLVPFSFAYLRIGASVGALVLFGVVQLTMISWGIARGERPAWPVWLGLAVAAGGLLALVLPSAARPDPLGLLLMVAAGMSWGWYSLRGKTAGDPLAANARSFALATGPALLVMVVAGHPGVATTRGVALAVISGAVTSGIGYAVWYRALRGLTAVQAAILQLCVPVLAAVSALPILGERPTVRLVAAGGAVLGGVALAMSSSIRRRGSAPPSR